MKQEADLKISSSRQKTLMKWEIPHLILLIKQKYNLDTLHFISPEIVPEKEIEKFFVIDGKTCFPIFFGQEFLGILIYFNILENRVALELRKYIDLYLNKSQVSYPLLIQQDSKEDFFKIAHDLYLKSPSFAFLNGEDFKWEQGIFQEMYGIFVCISSFNQLNYSQKKILIQSLAEGKISCRLVVGIKDQELLPLEWKTFFHNVI